MLNGAAFGLFLSASILLAITPGPGILYVLARTLRGGRSGGLRSTVGTAVGGLFHVLAAALGLSALLATSALAFSLIKYMGAAYLIYLGLKMMLSTESAESAESTGLSHTESLSQQAFRQGVITEALNPKTALFFLAFIPQFISSESSVFLQFVVLGSISVFLNTAADFIVVMLAGPIAGRLQSSERLRRAQHLVSGGALIALGSYVALSEGA